MLGCKASFHVKARSYSLLCPVKITASCTIRSCTIKSCNNDPRSWKQADKNIIHKLCSWFHDLSTETNSELLFVKTKVALMKAVASVSQNFICFLHKDGNNLQPFLLHSKKRKAKTACTVKQLRKSNSSNYRIFQKGAVLNTRLFGGMHYAF